MFMIHEFYVVYCGNIIKKWLLKYDIRVVFLELEILLIPHYTCYISLERCIPRFLSCVHDLD